MVETVNSISFAGQNSDEARKPAVAQLPADATTMQQNPRAMPA